MLDSPVSTEWLAHVGWDYIALDVQHGLIGYSGMVAGLTAIDASDSAVGLVRVEANDVTAIGRALDAGAAGVIVPMVNDADEAAKAVAAGRYPPAGIRSYGPMRAQLRIGPRPADADRDTVILAMIETPGGLANVETICAVQGLDGVYIGPSDLRLALGGAHSQDPAVDDEFEAALKRVREAAAKAGIAAGIHTPDGTTAARRLSEGFTFATVASDLVHLKLRPPHTSRPPPTAEGGIVRHPSSRLDWHAPTGGSSLPAIPVIALTGYLGAGKTTLLNHVLRAPGARIGVVINDFGELNVDAALVTGQVDEPASIAGGCICCLPDDGGLDEALVKLADPGLGLDAIIVEASGLAEPVAISRMIRFSGVDRVRHGGVVDVIDAATHFDTVDRGGIPPARYGAASLVVVNKLDQIPEQDRPSALGRIETRVRERNPDAHIVGAIAGRVDPALLYDVSGFGDDVGQLSFRELLIDDRHHHAHADAVTATTDGCIDPGVLIDLLEQPPAGVYRLKGTVAIRYRERIRTYAVNVVGRSVHIATAPPTSRANCMVAVGPHFDVDDVRARVDAALLPHDGPVSAAGVRRLQRYRRLSV